jgi:hypothetical protein
MNTQAFRKFLLTRKLSEEKIQASIALAERFEAYIESTSGKFDAETAWAFCNLLIQEGQNTYDNLVTVARYGRFMKNNEIYVAILELLDGAEAQPNLYKKVGEVFGEEVREDVFAGIGVAPLGAPSTEKPRFLFPVIERLVAKVGQKKVEKLLSACASRPPKYPPTPPVPKMANFILNQFSMRLNTKVTKATKVG